MSPFSGRIVFIEAALAFSLLVFATSPVSAQTLPSAAALDAAQQNQPRARGASPSIGWGLKSGIQWPSVDDVSSGFDHIGGAIGIYLDFNSLGTFGVTGDVLFVNNPQSQEPGAPVGSMHFLEVPVMVRLRQPLNSSNRLAIYGIAGPAFNLKVSGDDAFQNQTVDFMFGGGFEVKDILLEARFKRGSRDSELAGVTSSFTQQTFAILVGFRMRP